MDALEESKARGFLGPQPIERQIRHAEGFARCWDQSSPTPPAALMDLGSGGGLPGLVLVERWGCRAVFLDSMLKRCAYLREVVADPRAPGSSDVVCERAEVAARDVTYEGAFDLVTARSFGPPAVTVECAARFLKVGGVLIVSEPPPKAGEIRWAEPGLARIGFSLREIVRFESGYAVLFKERPTPAEFPRSSGTPKKKPVF